MTGEIVEPIETARKENFKEVDITAISLIVDSIRDHLIPYIANIDTSKNIYDALTNLFTIKNVGQAISLKNELRYVRMTNDDIMASYFVRISQLRDQIKAIEDIVSEQELVNTTLSGLTRSWDAFAAGISSWKEAPSFEQLWTSCAQEESMLISRDRKKEALKRL